jgi:hypothetical protein
MDVRSLANITVLGPTPHLTAASVRSAGTHAEVAFSSHSGNVLLYDVASLVRYREELEFSVSDPSINFYVLLDQQPPSTTVYLLQLNAGQGTVQLFHRSTDGSQTLLGQAALPGLRSGQRLAMKVVVSPPRYTVSVGGRALIDATESQANSTPGKPGLAGSGDGGSVRIYRADLFAQDG